MGTVIRKDAAVEDIIADTKETYSRALARQGQWQTLAEERVGPVVKLIDSFAAQHAEAEKAASPLLITLDLEKEKADLVIGKVSDAIWNAVGRPASDPSLSILFPGGNSFYVDGDAAEQPDRMDLLVQLLVAGVHPKLPAATSTAAADEVKVAGTALRAAVDTARTTRTRVKLLERVQESLARTAAIELAGYKRLLKAHGFTEAEIHTVIPHRPRSASKSPGKPASPPAGAAPSGGGSTKKSDTSAQTSSPTEPSAAASALV